MAKTQRMPDRMPGRKQTLLHLSTLQSKLVQEDRFDDSAIVASAIMTIHELMKLAAASN
jgi:hypothetical protein